MARAGSWWLDLVRLANRKTRNSRLWRQIGISAYTSIVRANVFLPPPRVLLNGPPKSGTHLLSDCMSLMPRMMFSGRHFALSEFFTTPLDPGAPETLPPLDAKRLERYLRRCPNGMFVTAHARYHPDLLDLANDLGFKHILLLRDPRDVAVSHSYHMLQDTLHQHHRYYIDTLQSNEERLMASIRGFEDGPGRRLPSIGQVLSRYLPWLDHPSTMVVRFEDLVGPRGGGDPGKQLDEIERISGFVGRSLNREGAQQIARKMYAKGSLTFRKGQTGDWQNHFTAVHRAAFEETAGDLLVRLGYAKGAEW